MTSSPERDKPVFLICGGTAMPDIVATHAAAAGRRLVMVNITGEYQACPGAQFEQIDLDWGELGKLFRLMHDAGCEQVAVVGSVKGRPRLGDIRVDLSIIKYVPRVYAGYRKGDDGLLRTMAEIFAENGFELISPLDLAPGLAASAGRIAGPRANSNLLDDIDRAAAAARALGALDIGQAAIAINGRVVAVEGAEGTDGMMARLPELRKSGRVPQEGGVLVKCMKPQQDSRLDIPTIGPETANVAKKVGLIGIGVEAGRCLMAGRDETIDAFRRNNLTLIGIESKAC